MAAWSSYRMWYQPAHGVASGGSSAFWLADWKPTDHIFRGRTQAEAQKKADRFWRDAQLGAGSMEVRPITDQQARGEK